MAETSFEKLKQWYEAIQNANPNADGTYTVEGKKVSPKEYKARKKGSKIVYDDAVKLRKTTAAKTEAETLAKAEAGAKAEKETKQKADDKISTAESDKRRLERLQRENQIDALLLAGEKIPPELGQARARMGYPLAGEGDSSRIELRNKEISEITVRLANTTTEPEKAASAPTVKPTTTTPTTSTTGSLRANNSDKTGGLTPLQTEAKAKAKADKTALAANKAVADSKASPTDKAKAALAAKALADAAIAKAKAKTASDAAKAKTVADASTVDVNGKKVAVGSDAWKTIVQEEFGSLWDVYNDNPDVKAAIDKSVKEGYYKDEVKLSAALSDTDWFRTTQESARNYTIRQSTDPASLKATVDVALEEIRASSVASGLALSDSSLQSLAENKVKYKWSPQQQLNAIGSEGVMQAQAGGGQGISDLRRASTGTTLRAIADNYSQKPTDEMLDGYIAEVMKGTKSKEQFVDLMKQNATAQFRSLAPLIEKGQDVKTSVAMYTNSAKAILGVDPNTIDWTQDKWNKALNYQDPKTNEYRQMDSWEWNKYLRNLPEWQETDDAKRVYSSAAFSLAQAFGRTT